MMKALVYQSGKTIITQLPVPTITGDDEVLLQVLQAGLCRTDLLVAEGAIPGCEGSAFGHEFCGKVIATGNKVTNFFPGQRAAVNPVLACGKCSVCQSGNDYLCGSSGLLGINAPGAFAEYIKVSATQCYQVSDNIPDKLVAYAEPVAAMLSILNCGIQSQQQVGVIGSDRIAMLCQFILSTAGLDVVTANKEYPVDVLIITSFINEQLPINLVKPGGLIIIKSRSPFLSKVCYAEIVQRRLTLLGVNYAPFIKVLKFIESHHQMLMSFLGPSFSLDRFAEAFKADSAKKVFLMPCAG
ncbi:alcohol dehydrogenase catalytic domain-containing protein [Spartinivicinus ruber]|uniref:alcohol dehydrogenase catalytic domain-containing protein n=1 Tax=Spartinivicinus ruber TaxID=2683272 RepID=UPI0013D4CA23|nr:alcohol dehydrogenase catalytic domain-containing protein [Spartinivicinus ruber]